MVLSELEGHGCEEFARRRDTLLGICCCPRMAEGTTLSSSLAPPDVNILVQSLEQSLANLQQSPCDVELASVLKQQINDLVSSVGHPWDQVLPAVDRLMRLQGDHQSLLLMEVEVQDLDTNIEKDVISLSSLKSSIQTKGAELDDHAQAIARINMEKERLTQQIQALQEQLALKERELALITSQHDACQEKVVKMVEDR